MRPGRNDAAVEEVAWLRRLAARVAGGAQADDLAQDALLAALRGRRPAGDRRRWLAGILRNLARLEHRRRLRRARREAAVARPVATPPALRRVEEDELRRRLHASVDALPEPYRAAVRGRHLEGRTCAELARAQGVPASTMRNRLRRGLLMLREGLGRAYDGDPRALALLLALPARPRRRRLALAAAVLATCALALPASAAPAPARAEEDVVVAVPVPSPRPSPEAARDEPDEAHSRYPRGVVAP